MSEISQTNSNAESGQGRVIARIEQGQDPVKVVERWFEQSDEKPWINLSAGETKTFIFMMNKIEKVEKEFKGQKKMQYRFSVVTEDNQEKTIDFSPRWAKTIFDFLKEGYQRIKITRQGSSTDTEYKIIPLQH